MEFEPSLYLTIIVGAVLIYFLIDLKKSEDQFKKDLIKNAVDFTSQIEVPQSITSDSEGPGISKLQFVKAKDSKVYMIPFHSGSFRNSPVYLLNSFSKDNDLLEYEVIEFNYSLYNTKLKLDNYNLIPDRPIFYLDMSKTEYDKVKKWLKK